MTEYLARYLIPASGDLPAHAESCLFAASDFVDAAQQALDSGKRHQVPLLSIERTTPLPSP